MDYLKADRKIIEQNSIDLEEKNEKIEEYCSNERVKFQEELFPLFKTVATSDMNSLIQLQAESLSLRQRINDQLTTYLSLLTKKNSQFRKISGDRMEFYMTGFGVKTSIQERVQFMDRDLREVKRSVELIQNHIEYLRECRTSCDQIGYAVKNRIQLLNYM